MTSFIINALVLIGCAFVFIAALGVFRFPDFYTRLHAATKAGALGGAILALASGVSFMNGVSLIQASLIIGFFYVTTPVAGHLLGRAAFLRRVPLYAEKPANAEIPAMLSFNKNK